MRIIVCVKQVPDTETKVRVESGATSIVEGDVNWIISPYDEFAIEEALRIKESKTAEVVLISAGPERVQSALRTGLAMGADSALHIKDPLLDAADPAATAKALATAAKTLAPFDLILTGQQGVGGDHSQVPGLLAEALDLPQVTMALKVEVGDGNATVVREIEGGRETWETSLPAVLSAQKGLNEPRYASLKGIMAAKKKQIRTVSAVELGLDASAVAPKVRVVALELPPPRPAVRLLEGEPAEQAKALVKLLHEEAKVI